MVADAFHWREHARYVRLRTRRDDGPTSASFTVVAGLKVELKEKLTGIEGDVNQLIEKARFEKTKRQELRLEKEETRRL